MTFSILMKTSLCGPSDKHLYYETDLQEKSCCFLLHLDEFLVFYHPMTDPICFLVN